MLEYINIVLDCTDPQSPIFVEIEDDNGNSVNVGEWSGKDENGYNKIRIKMEVRNESNIPQV